MSASIVRAIVAQLLHIKPQHVVLSGEISPDFNINGGSSYSSSCGSSWDTFSIYSWSPKDGLKQINNDSSSSTGSGDRYNANNLPLHEVVTGNELFFIIKSSKNRGTWDGAETHETTSLFKAPDFLKKWDAIETEDVTRWETWIKLEEEALKSMFFKES